jgi:hypothetical protein
MSQNKQRNCNFSKKRIIKRALIYSTASPTDTGENVLCEKIMKFKEKAPSPALLSDDVSFIMAG